MRVDEMEKLPIDHPDHISNTSTPVKPVNDRKVFFESDNNESFKVGQRVVITGGKHKKQIKDNEVCIIQEVRKTFLVIQVSSPESLNGRTLQCHRKFITSFKEEQPEPTPSQSDVLDNGGHEMPTMDDCVLVQELPPNDDEQGQSSISSNIVEVEEDVVEDPVPEEQLTQNEMKLNDEIVRLKGVISDLEADIVSYRDMMLGHQNELEYLRKETGPTQEEKKMKNEKLIECIKILLSLQ